MKIQGFLRIVTLLLLFATVAPKWLLEEVAGAIKLLNKYVPEWLETYGDKKTDNQ